MEWDWSWLSHFEWIIVEVLVLGLLLWQLVSVRREINESKRQSLESTMPMEEEEDEY